MRERLHIVCEGTNIPPPLLAFKDMRVPEPIIKHLASKGIKTPTPIQIQVSTKRAPVAPSSPQRMPCSRTVSTEMHGQPCSEHVRCRLRRPTILLCDRSCGSAASRPCAPLHMHYMRTYTHLVNYAWRCNV